MSSNNAQKVYNEIIQDLSPTEQFQLATLILNRLSEQGSSNIDQRDYWTEQDQTDAANFSRQYAASLLHDEEAI